MPSFFNQSKKQNAPLSTWISIMYIISAAYAESSLGQPSEASSPVLFHPQNQTAPSNTPPRQLPPGKRDDGLAAVLILSVPAVMTLALILYLVIRSKRSAVVPPDLELQVREEVAPNKDDPIASPGVS